MNKKQTEVKNKTDINAKVKQIAQNHYITRTIQNKTEAFKISPEKQKARNSINTMENEYNFSTEGSSMEYSFDNRKKNFYGEEKMVKITKTSYYVQKNIREKERKFIAVKHNKLFSLARNRNSNFEISQEIFQQFGVNYKLNHYHQDYLGANARKVIYEQQRSRDRDEPIRRPMYIEKVQEKIVALREDDDHDPNQNFEDQVIKKELFNFIINECLTFKLPNKTFIKKEFNDKNHYMKIMMLMIKEQISSTIIQTIEKTEEKSQKGIKISLTKTGQSKHFSKQEDQLQIIATEPEQKKLKSILLKGACLGIITKSLPINKEKLISNQDQSFLCLVRAINVTGKIIVEGLEHLQDRYKLPDLRYNYGKQMKSELKQNEFYFIDLTPITSLQRQYIAVSRSLSSPLIQTIINNTTVRQSQSKLQSRQLSLQSNVFREIQRNQNPSQVQAIRTAFQNDTGIYLIQGPPGTGKTECITNLIGLQYYHQIKTKQNKKILVCAQSNAAVDHIARKILKNGLIGIDKNPSILKLGAEDQASDEALDINLKHICQIDVLDTAGQRKNWSVDLMGQFQKVKQELERKKQSGASLNVLNLLQKNLNIIVARLQENKKNLAKKKNMVQIFQREHIDRCQIIFSTLNGSGNTDIINLVKDQIACVIIDQASQATEPSTLIPLLTGVKKMVLVGDHMQLQPTVISAKAKKTQYSRSLFQRLIHCGVKPHLLNIQYRMHPQLSRFSSMHFYDNKIKNGSKLSTPKSLSKIKNAALLIDLQYAKEANKNKSFYNETEANCIIEFVHMLLREDKKLQIGVISPYKEQIKLIQAKLQQLEVDEQANVRVSTVDAFQGQEVDVAIFSCVRANDHCNIGFLLDKKRLNVAITRAKHAAVIFGNMNTFKDDEIWKAFIDHHSSQKTLKTATNVKNCTEILRENIFGLARQTIPF